MRRVPLALRCSLGTILASSVTCGFRFVIGSSNFLEGFVFFILTRSEKAKSHLVSRLKKYKCNPILAGAAEIPSIYKISTPFSLGIKALILHFLC